MTPTEAAELIGIKPQSVRDAIRAGNLKAKKVPMPGGQFVYDITRQAAEAYAHKPLRSNGKRPQGRPRGHSPK